MTANPLPPLPTDPAERMTFWHLAAQWKWTAAFVIGCGVAGEMVDGGHVALWRGVAAILVPCALLFGMVRENNQRVARRGCATPAGRRYTGRARIWAVGYMAAIFGAIWGYRTFAIHGPALWVVALLPAIPILYLLWSLGRYFVEETDEYQRMKTIFAATVATGVLLATATIWGFLELFGLVPHVESWTAMPIWALGLGVGQLVNRLRGA